ncbi:MAG: hypothetical protein CL797_11445 [Chromatiales bacterium]|nr:hypothetical protein [Chromatiales bacterium]
MALCATLIFFSAHCQFVRAGDIADLMSVELYPTISNAGVEAHYFGQNKENAAVSIRYRVVGTDNFLIGHPPALVAQYGFVGSIFNLLPDTDYEVEISLSISGEVVTQQIATMRTRPDSPPPIPPDGRQIFVDIVNGKAVNPGTRESPLASIQSAVSLAKAGDIVRVMPGIYRESITVRRKGAQTRPIYLIAEGEGVILDGSDPDIGVASEWINHGDGIYSVKYRYSSAYLAIEDLRLYDYGSLDDLKQENGRQPGKNGLIKGGFYIDQAKSRLFLRLPDHSAPTGREVYVARLDSAIQLNSSSHIVVRGFEIRYFGASEFGSVGIDLRSTAESWIQDNDIHHVNYGIRVRNSASAMRNVIEDNRLRDTGVWTWDWHSVKQHTPEGIGIGISQGRGNVVRRNRIEGFFNGILAGNFHDHDPSIAHDTDILDNHLSKLGDDGLEVEGACINVRLLGNRIKGVFSAVSLTPVSKGPVWVVRNVIDDYRAWALKIGNGNVGWLYLYHNTAYPHPGYPDAQIMRPPVPFGYMIARNNIWLSNRYMFEFKGKELLGPVDLDYDVLWTNGPVTDQQYRFKWLGEHHKNRFSLTMATGLELNGIERQPEFRDAENGDFMPRNGSVMIDAASLVHGVNTLHFLGDAPDIGALEYNLDDR